MWLSRTGGRKMGGAAKRENLSGLQWQGESVNSTTGNPEFAGSCQICGGARWQGLAHQCTTAPQNTRTVPAAEPSPAPRTEGLLERDIAEHLGNLLGAAEMLTGPAMDAA